MHKINVLAALYEYDGETVLCNLGTAQMLMKTDNCKRIKHYWNNRLENISKPEVKEMLL